ncbi:DUF881 domain-containing protein [Clostridium sp. D2Q-11]|uniref:DUF881 domain-containing protein n=1 Tax=Anaeromonas frigoriresistens TaxID=2683708 RepID=A0A942Z8R4_9FIRM|nr:DUF881 domain-containing protein [Anaeromonas frigoriresistens]MBS4540082.1 DUF881 domain-containing protein [Anaeromonas frigoriresistens]
MNKYVINGIIFIMCIALGIIIPYQIRNNIGENSYVPLSTIKETQAEVNKTKSEIENIQILINEQDKKLDQLKDADTKDVVEILEKDIEKIKNFGGFNDLEGPGLILTINDSDKKFNEEWDDSSIVHEGDIQNIINDLKVAGAEAMSVRGERLIHTSAVQCNGPVLRVNNKNLPAPFTIYAIGNPRKLSAAINAPGTYGRYLKDGRGLRVESEERNYIVIPRYNNSLDIKYMQPVEEGE